MTRALRYVPHIAAAGVGDVLANADSGSGEELLGEQMRQRYPGG